MLSVAIASGVGVVAGDAEQHGRTHEIEIGGKRTFTVEAGVQFGLDDATPETAAKLQVTLAY
jgi:hypothetical protein